MSNLSSVQTTILNTEIKNFSRLRSSSGIRNCVYFVDDTYITIDWNSTLNKHWNDKSDTEFLIYLKAYLVKRVGNYEHKTLKRMGR